MITPTPIKHPQFIFSVDQVFFTERGFTTGLHEFPIERFYAEAMPYLSIRQRDAMEDGSPYPHALAQRQLLPYTIVAREGRTGTEYLPYQRLKGGGEPGLHDLVSVGFGGHPDLEDLVVMGDTPDTPEISTPWLQATLHKSGMREMGQELNLFSKSGGHTPFAPKLLPSNWFIHDNTRPVDCHHVALIQFAQAEPTDILLSGEATNIKLLEWATPSVILQRHPNLETWSRLFLEYAAQAESRR